MEENKFTIHKVPIDVLLTILEELWNKGADFIDIIGTINPEAKEDKIGIIVRKEYMNSEAGDFEFERDEFIQNDIPLSEKDLNDLL